MAETGCTVVGELLAASRGDIERLPREARDHLASCRACTELARLLRELAVDGDGASPDYLAADRALATARGILDRRKASLELILFAAVAGVVSTCVAAAGLLGYGLPLLALQGAAALGLPFAGYFALRRKLAREEA